MLALQFCIARPKGQVSRPNSNTCISPCRDHGIFTSVWIATVVRHTLGFPLDVVSRECELAFAQAIFQGEIAVRPPQNV